MELNAKAGVFRLKSFIIPDPGLTVFPGQTVWWFVHLMAGSAVLKSFLSPFDVPGNGIHCFKKITVG